MFERYSERARRLVFYARYEASQRGGKEIEPRDLFLGATHDMHRPGCPFGGLYEGRAAMRALLLREVNPATAAEVDVPLSKASQEALAYAAQETDRDLSRAIGIDHLLRGALRTKDRAAVRVAQVGYGLNALRSASQEVQKAAIQDGGGGESALADGRSPARVVSIGHSDYQSRAKLTMQAVTAANEASSWSLLRSRLSA